MDIWFVSRGWVIWHAQEYRKNSSYILWWKYPCKIFFFKIRITSSTCIWCLACNILKLKLNLNTCSFLLTQAPAVKCLDTWPLLVVLLPLWFWSVAHFRLNHTYKQSGSNFALCNYSAQCSSNKRYNKRWQFSHGHEFNSITTTLNHLKCYNKRGSCSEGFLNKIFPSTIFLGQNKNESGF